MDNQERIIRFAKNIASRLLAVFLIVHIQGCGLGNTVTKAKKETKTYTVTKKSFINTLHFSDYIRPIRSVSVLSPTDGHILESFIHYGANVKKDEVLLKISSVKLEEDYDSAVADYLRAKDAFDTSEMKFTGTEDLWKLGLVSRNDYISQKSNLDATRVALLQSTKKLETNVKKIDTLSIEDIKKLSIADEAAVNKALLQQFQSLEVKAEISGILLEPPKSATGENETKISMSVGNELKKGQIIALIGDFSGISFQIKITEIDLDKIKIGQKAIITGVAFPGIKLKGQVRSITSQSTTTGGSVGGLPTFPALVEVPNLSPQEKQAIRVGMSATIEIQIEKQDLLLIPIAAVYQKNSLSLVKRLEGKNIVEVPITTGETSLQEVIVTSGLKEGDQILYQEKEAGLVNH